MAKGDINITVRVPATQLAGLCLYYKTLGLTMRGKGGIVLNAVRQEYSAAREAIKTPETVEESLRYLQEVFGEAHTTRSRLSLIKAEADEVYEQVKGETVCAQNEHRQETVDEKRLREIQELFDSIEE